MLDMEVAHAAMDRLSYDMATELKDHNVKSYNNASRSEITAFPDGESPTYVGRAVLSLMEQADKKFLDKRNGKTVFTIDLAKKFGFREDYDADGSVNEARYEGSGSINK